MNRKIRRRSPSHAFRSVARRSIAYRSVDDRLGDYLEVQLEAEGQDMEIQAERCMDCGVPFCQSGCPLGNYIPDFNAAVATGDWKLAYEVLIKTNNFPEFTGRICPAPCESACVLGINKDPVTIENLEKTIIEEAFRQGWVLPTTKSRIIPGSVAIIGSGPAGLAAADQLSKIGLEVHVYEKNLKPGGLLRYGIPDFKLDKQVIDRRIALLQKSGVRFHCGLTWGVDFTLNTLRAENDAILIAIGSEVPRDLMIPGRSGENVHFAMDYLVGSNQFVAAELPSPPINVKDEHVIIIGGGDTGADCVGTAHRQGAASVTQLELMPMPSLRRHESTPWPNWPLMLRTSTSHEEGGERKWSVQTRSFVRNELGKLTGLEVVQVEWQYDASEGTSSFQPIPDTKQILSCDRVFLALGFLHPHQNLLLEEGVVLQKDGKIKDHAYQTTLDGVFAAGDARRGQSLVVWAIQEGRAAADAMMKYLEEKDAALDSTCYYNGQLKY